MMYAFPRFTDTPEGPPGKFQEIPGQDRGSGTPAGLSPEDPRETPGSVGKGRKRVHYD